jgi:phage shock protein C
MARRLYRSETEKMVGGVCGGLGEVLDVDPTIIRVVFVLLAFLGGHGILLYLILWLIMPRQDQIKPETKP